MAKEARSSRVAAEAVYDVNEIAENAYRLFGYSVDLAKAAFRHSKLKCCSLDKAKKLIKEFAERKVN